MKDMKTKKILIAVICVLAVAVVALSAMLVIITHKPNASLAFVKGNAALLSLDLPDVPEVIDADENNQLETNKPAIEQMTENELEFYNALLYNINLYFTSPSTVHVVRVSTNGLEEGKYLAILRWDSLFGKISEQFLITQDSMEDTSEIYSTVTRCLMLI